MDLKITQFRINISYALFILITACQILPLRVFALGAEKQEEILVQLTTDTPLLPVFVSAFETKNCQYSPEYLKSLKGVLEFDLNYNGMTRIIKDKELKHVPPKERSLTFDAHENASSWKKDHVFYLFKTLITGQQLTLKVVSITGQTTKTLDGITLCGDLSQDRRRIHQLSDAILHMLFNKQGIATTRILYAVKTLLPSKNPKERKWASEIYESDYDGANVRQLTHDMGFCVTPAYIPPKPGAKSAAYCFVSYKIGQPKIYYGMLKGGKPQRLSTLKGNQLMPAISQDRSQIAFISDVTGCPDLFLIPFHTEEGALGKPKQIFAAKKATQASPSFSPDGKQIAFVSNKDGSPKIYIMQTPTDLIKAKDCRASLISKKNRENTSPSWSPDGKKIAYSSQVQGVRQIWVCDVETRQEKQITQGSKNKENPSWAPDSLHLVFNATDAQGSELYIINLNQTEAVKISNGSGEKRYPAWEPRFGNDPA